MRRIRAGLNAGRFEVLVDADFETTMRACAAPRGGREGTWITEEMLGAYCELHFPHVALREFEPAARAGPSA